MEDLLFNQVKTRLDEELQTSILTIMDKNGIPYHLSNDEANRDKSPLVAFFATHCDLSLSKKKTGKYKQTHPNIDISFSCEPSFDYSYLTEPSSEILLANILFIHDILKKTEWTMPVTSKIKFWSKILFHNLMAIYSEKYGITLFRLPFEVFLESPDNMFISRLPELKDLTFVKSSSLSTPVLYDEFLNQQYDIIKGISNFQKF